MRMYLCVLVALALSLTLCGCASTRVTVDPVAGPAMADLAGKAATYALTKHATPAALIIAKPYLAAAADVLDAAPAERGAKLAELINTQVDETVLPLDAADRMLVKGTVTDLLKCVRVETVDDDEATRMAAVAFLRGAVDAIDELTGSPGGA